MAIYKRVKLPEISSRGKKLAGTSIALSVEPSHEVFGQPRGPAVGTQYCAKQSARCDIFAATYMRIYHIRSDRCTDFRRAECTVRTCSIQKPEFLLRSFVQPNATGQRVQKKNIKTDGLRWRALPFQRPLSSLKRRELQVRQERT